METLFVFVVVKITIRYSWNCCCCRFISWQVIWTSIVSLILFDNLCVRWIFFWCFVLLNFYLWRQDTGNRFNALTRSYFSYGGHWPVFFARNIDCSRALFNLSNSNQLILFKLLLFSSNNNITSSINTKVATSDDD